jgi:hypothetical protein
MRDLKLQYGSPCAADGGEGTAETEAPVAFTALSDPVSTETSPEINAENGKLAQGHTILTWQLTLS